MKDLIDLVLISELASSEHGQLQDAIITTFRERETLELPMSLPAPPSDWTRPYRVLGAEVGLEPDVASGYRAAAAFLDPVLGGAPGLDRWDKHARIWQRRS